MENISGFIGNEPSSIRIAEEEMHIAHKEFLSAQSRYQYKRSVYESMCKANFKQFIDKVNK